MTGRSASAPQLRDLAWLRRVRDRIDREYALPLDVEALARGAYLSAGHLSRQFRLAFGESPSAYLMTQRIEPSPPGCGRTEEERRTIVAMMAKGTYGWILLATKDLDGVFARLQASGAEVVQEPTEQPTGFATAPSVIPPAT